MLKIGAVLLFTVLLICVGPSYQESPAESNGDRKTTAGKKNKAVTVAPEADLLNGIDDIDPKG
jgi:hypothetical protein